MTDRVCWECIGDEILSAEIRDEGTIATCPFCNALEPRPTKTVEELAPRIAEKFREEYSPGEMRPKFSDHSDKVSFVQEGESPAWRLQEMLDMEPEVAEAIADWIAENDDENPYDGGTPLFDGETQFVQRDPSPQSWETWRRFEWSSKHHGRFFDAELRSLLDLLFKDMHSFVRTSPTGLFDDLRSGGESPFFTITPRDELSIVFRARSARSREEAERFAANAATDIGTPPSSSATAGRMNAGGIGVFYGAFSARTCLAEIRPRVGGLAAIARFRIVRQVRLLDFTKFNEHFLAESVFSPNHAARRSTLSFLQQIGQIIARPVQPHEELLDYVPTQILAEYLRSEHRIDGLVYPSAQIGSSPESNDHTRRKDSNIVLFQRASRVADGHDTTDQTLRLEDPRPVTLALDVRHEKSGKAPVHLAEIGRIDIGFEMTPLADLDESDLSDDSDIMF